MALRIRENGAILCAAMHPELPGDTYLHDGISYRLTVIYGVIVTEPMERHALHGRWWWRDEVPDGIAPETFPPIKMGQDEAK